MPDATDRKEKREYSGVEGRGEADREGNSGVSAQDVASLKTQNQSKESWNKTIEHTFATGGMPSIPVTDKVGIQERFTMSWEISSVTGPMGRLDRPFQC